MKKDIQHCLTIFCLLTGGILLLSMDSNAQQNSVVQVHADKSSGYGVAYGGPQNLPDRIVTALHVVAGKSTILVVWQGKQSQAYIEKIYKASDLALLRLQTPLGIPPMALYSGNPPWDTNVQFWEIPVNTRQLTAKTTVLEETTSLSRISPRVANNSAGLSKALCMDAGQYYPGMTTEVINFKEPNIRKAHSGSPLTYNGKIIGLVDGGANLVGGKSCVWAIPSESFLRLYNQGTPYPGNMASCGGSSGNQYMYSGVRSDNPFLTPEEQRQAAGFENSTIQSSGNSQFELYHEYRMSFDEVYENMFPEEQADLDELFDFESDFTINKLFTSSVDIYVEGSTGISLMVPTESELTTDQDENGIYLSTTSPGGSITITYFISSSPNMNSGMQIMQSFKDLMIEYGYNMTPHPEDIEDYRNDAYTPYYSEYVSQEFYNEYDEMVADFTGEIMVNDGDFFAIIVQVSDWSKLENNPNELHYLYLMESCALFSDFGYY